jgi:tetratricopeptide (TPR) repeat protein
VRLLASLDREPLAAQFVPVKIETGSNEQWRAWSRKYKHEGDAIPIVYVVRADGEQLYGHSGMPPALPAFLALHLRNAGRMLSPADLAELAEDAAAAQKLAEDGEIDEACALVSRKADSGSFAEAALAIDKLAAELSEQGQQALSAAEQKLEKPETAFDGALEFARVDRVYGDLEPVEQALRSLRAKYRKERVIRDLLDQAEWIEKAQAFEADEDFKRALATYRIAQSRFPETRAAELAIERIKKLEADGVVADSPAQPEGSDPAHDEERAAAQLRLARIILKRSPEKADEYLQKVIDLAPESAAAAEARKLMKKP